MSIPTPFFSMFYNTLYTPVSIKVKGANVNKVIGSSGPRVVEGNHLPTW